jgi:fucose permease
LLALAELMLALSFLASRARWRASEAAARVVEAGGDARPGRSALSPGMYASVGCFLVYAGLQAGTGLWDASLLIEVHGESLALVSGLIATYWGLLISGRFMLGLIVERWARRARWRSASGPRWSH